LFVGYALDPARVGRSFLKFALPAPPSGSNAWAGSVNAYYARSAAAGTTTIGCQALANDSWVGSTLKWSTAPALVPAAARRAVAVTYTSGGTGGDAWCHWS